MFFLKQNTHINTVLQLFGHCSIITVGDYQRLTYEMRPHHNSDTDVYEFYFKNKELVKCIKYFNKKIETRL